jgi:hypothetical protein
VVLERRGSVHASSPGPGRGNEPLEDSGRPLGLRLLALLGAASFLLLGIASIVPLLQWLRMPPAPSSPLDPRQRPVGLRRSPSQPNAMALGPVPAALS